MITEQRTEFNKRVERDRNSNGKKLKKMKTCECGIGHTGYYGEICAVCMVYKRAGVSGGERGACKLLAF